MRSTLHYQLAHRFDELCHRLRESAAAEHLARPLVFWAAPQDRRLPKPLLEHSLARIVETPFDKLAAAPCVGVKKLAMLNELLARALAAADRGAPAVATESSVSPPAGDVGVPGEPSFNPEALLRSQWAEWCAAVKRHGLAREPLGRFAVALRDLPANLWRTPLATYADLTLDEIYRRKTHGKKRIRVVVEVFAAVQSLLGAGPATHLSVRVAPGFAAAVEVWLLDVLHQGATAAFPSIEEVQRSFVNPLLSQLRQDVSSTAHQLAADRLWRDPATFSAPAAAKELGFTRQRIYQLLKEASTVMSVRWPEGAKLVHALRQKAEAISHAGAALFLRAANLFFPGATTSIDASQTDGAQQAPDDRGKKETKKRAAHVISPRAGRPLSDSERRARDSGPAPRQAGKLAHNTAAPASSPPDKATRPRGQPARPRAIA